MKIVGLYIGKYFNGVSLIFIFFQIYAKYNGFSVRAKNLIASCYAIYCSSNSIGDRLFSSRFFWIS